MVVTSPAYVTDTVALEKGLCHCLWRYFGNILLYLAQVFSMVLGLDSRQLLNEASLRKTW